MSSNHCLYIPRMSSFVTEVMLEDQLSQLIGKIKRVDFTPINKKLGFTENINDNYKSAFIHFYYMTPYYQEYFNKGDPYKLNPNLGSSEFWILLKCKNPVQETMMNNSQIVENCRFLEKKVEEQAKTIKVLEDKVQGIHNVVYNLLGGLFNQETQRATLTNYLRELFPSIEEKISYENPDTSEWATWPTTRQGDDNERRIFDLEEQMKCVYQNDYGEEAIFKLYEEYSEENTDNNILKDVSSTSDDELTISTHSSMPELIENYSEYYSENNDNDSINEDDSLPELESIKSSELSMRLRNSFSLLKDV